MATIEERAIEYAFGKHCVRYGKDSNGNNVVWKCSDLEDGCSCFPFEKTCEQFVEIATEQDQIARQEERERCIEKAWDFFLRNMGNEHNQVITKFVDDDGEIVWRETYEDDFYDMLRKAIEEGGEV